MSLVKIIYGIGRVPRASEFALGEIVVNVDDSKVYSKNKSNTVFELGAGTTTTTSNGIFFATASISGSGTITATTDNKNLIISGGTGISVTTGSNNDITITATGDASVDASNINGTIDIDSQTNLAVSDTTGQTGINFTFSSDTISAVAENLSVTSPVRFLNITASNDIQLIGDSSIPIKLKANNTNFLEISSSGIVLSQSSATPIVGALIYSSSNFYAGVEN
jgi:hypothetical protein